MSVSVTETNNTVTIQEVVRSVSIGTGVLAAQIWQRTGTTISPTTANDNVNIGTGAFTGATFNGVALTAGGDGTTYLANDGTYKALASYWDRTGTVLSPATAGDSIRIGDATYGLTIGNSAQFLNIDTQGSGAVIDIRRAGTSRLTFSGNSATFHSSTSVSVANTTASTSATTGALVVSGGVGVGGDVNIASGMFLMVGQGATDYVKVASETTGGVVYLADNSANVEWSIKAVGQDLRFNRNGLDMMKLTNSTSIITFSSEVNAKGLVGVTNVTDSTSTSTGALTVTGGAGIVKNLYVGGLVRFTSTTASTSTTTGALTVSGGAGFVGDVYIGGKLNVAGLIDPTGLQFDPVASNPGDAYTIWVNSADGNKLYYGAAVAGITDHGALGGLGDDDHTQYHTAGRADTWLGTKTTADLTEGTNLYWTTARGQAVIDADVTLVKVDGSRDITGAISITDVTSSTSTTTGALKVSGGVGVLENVRVGGNVYATSAITGDVGETLAGSYTSDFSNAEAEVDVDGVGWGNNVIIGANPFNHGNYNTSASSPYIVTVSSGLVAGTVWGSFDGVANLGGRCLLNAVPSNLTIDTGTPRTIFKYRVFTEYNQVGGRFSPTEWALDGSNNGTDWTEIDHRNIDPIGLAWTDFFDIATPASYRHYRMRYISNSYGGIAGFIEIDLREGNYATTTNTFQWRPATATASKTYDVSTIALTDSTDAPIGDGSILIEYSTNQGSSWSSQIGLNAFKALSDITTTDLWFRFEMVGATKLKTAQISTIASTVTIGTALTLTVSGSPLATLDSVGLNLGQTTASSSTSTGALVVAGGVGIGGNLVVGGVRVSMANLPTSSSGLTTGDIWNDAGTLKIV